MPIKMSTFCVSDNCGSMPMHQLTVRQDFNLMQPHQIRSMQRHQQSMQVHPECMQPHQKRRKVTEIGRVRNAIDIIVG